jgi:hypothetical protein
MTYEQLTLDQYAESLVTQLLLEQEARKREAECRAESTPASRIFDRFGYSIYSESDFFSNVNKESASIYQGTHCWEWMGKRTRDWWDPDKPGYGEYGGMFAYRFAWEIIAGREYVKGKELHHMGRVKCQMGCWRRKRSRLTLRFLACTPILAFFSASSS